MSSSQSTAGNFGFGDEEAMIRDAARSMLAQRLPTDGLRRLVAASPRSVYEQGQPAPWDRQLWVEIAELGWSGLAIGAVDGGSDISMAGVAGVIEEVGRHALPSPLIPTLSAAVVLRQAGGDVSRERLGRIAANASAASLAVTNTEGSWDPADAPLLAQHDGDTVVLQGIAGFVQDAGKADFFVASARLGEQTLLCVVDRDATGLRLEPDHIHDLTRDQASLHFERVRVAASAIVSRDGLAVLRQAWPRLLVLVAADLCGASEWLLQTTVAYATQRVQFDRPIGFFQAVKHPLVNAMLDIDRARSLLYYACAEIDAGSDKAEMAARMAKSAASDAAAFVSDRAIQLHGGIGFTWEHALHIYFKRNLHNQVLLGDANYQRRMLADMLIGPIGAAHG